jgi:hypothetical protein
MASEITSGKSRISSWLPVLGLIGLGLAVRVWVIARTEVPARDSIGFIRYALRLESESFFDVIRTAEQPPGYPLAVMLVSWPVRAWTGEVSCDTMALSAQLANALMAVLSIPFMFLLGRELCDKRIGWLAAGMFLLLPAWVKLTSDGLSEGAFLFWLSLTVWLGARALRTPTTFRFLLCGLTAGCGYLTRPEGLELAAAIGAILIMRQGAPAWRQRWRRLVPQAAALACGVLALLGPYVATIGKLSNKNTIKLMQGDPNANWQALPHAARSVPPSVAGLSEAGASSRTAGVSPWVAPPTGLRPRFLKTQTCLIEASHRKPAPAARTPLAVWWFEPTDQGKSHALWGISALVKETFQSLHYGVAIFALFGLAWFRARPRGRLGAWLLVALFTGHALIVWWMAAKIGYFSERHTLLFVFAACYPAAAAIVWLAQRHGTGVACTVIAGLFAAALPAIAKPLHANRAGHRAAGRWLAANTTPADQIMDPFNWAEFYACDHAPGLKQTAVPTSDRLFVVLEQTDNQHSRLPVIPAAKAAALAGEVVYHWPEKKPRDQAQVVIYEVSKRRLGGG